jgi:biopolymer transport protein ExbB
MTDLTTFGAGASSVRRRMRRAVISGATLTVSSGVGIFWSVSAYAAAKAVPLSTIVVPRNVTYWEMFANATAVVKTVMILLIFASIATWTMWLSKLAELRSARRRLSGDIRVLGSADSIEAAGTVKHGAVATMLQLCRNELSRAGRIRSQSAADGVKERAAARLVATETSTIERMLRGTAVLATIGAIAPFVGLFGTVWGIMNSFIGISQSNTTNLAVVAPGIAEALLATAMGLVAAIPAVIMYNHVARAIAGFRRQLSEASTQVACLLSQDLDVQLDALSSGASVRAA